MGDIENTAVNELIARASGPASGPVSGPASGPAPRTPPVKMPVAAPFETTLPMSYPMVSRPQLAPSIPLGAPQGSPDDAPAWAPPADGERLDPRQLYQRMHQPDRERLVPTFHIRRRSEVRTVVSRLVLPIAVLVSAGIAIGAYVAFGGDSVKPHGELAASARGRAAAAPSTPAPALAPAPAPAPTVAPAEPAPESAANQAAMTAPAEPVAPSGPADVAAAAPAPAPADEAPAVPAAAALAAPLAPAAIGAAAPPALVDVRIDSVPSGATVMLVDRGRTQLVGDTPIDTALDPSREYDLVFTHGDQPPHVEHLDARTTRRIAAVLEPRAGAVRNADSAPRRSERAGRDGAASKPGRARAELASGEGTLMISSKPPCEIVIDGRPTGLTTPQRSIALSAGNHKVTLINSEKSIKRTLSVQIAANATERIIEDLMK